MNPKSSKTDARHRGKEKPKVRRSEMWRGRTVSQRSTSNSRTAQKLRVSKLKRNSSAQNLRAERKAAELIAWAESPEFSFRFPAITSHKFYERVREVIAAYYDAPNEKKLASWATHGDRVLNGLV